MKFHLLYVSSVSACFELENTSPYYAGDAFEVTVNGAPALVGVRTNVFSLFDLQPETEYSVAIGEEKISFTTAAETGCISVKDFGAVGDGVTNDFFAIKIAFPQAMFVITLSSFLKMHILINYQMLCLYKA